MEIEDVKFYNRIFDIYALELEMGDLKNIDGDYLVKCVYLCVHPLYKKADWCDDGSILIWLYKIYGADKKTLNDKSKGFPLNNEGIGNV